MKKQIIFLFLVLSNTALVSQNSQYFNKLIFPYIAPNNLKSVVQFDSCYYALSGWLDTPYVHNQGISVIKFDNTGNIIDKNLWWDTIHSYFIYPGNSLIKTHDSGLIICGGVGFNYNTKAILWKVSNNLDTIWTHTFTHPDTMAASLPGADIDFQFTAVKQTFDNGFIITGNYNKDCITGNLKSFLLKTDSLGNFEWIKKYNNINYVYNIEITQDSGFTFAAYVNSSYVGLVKTDLLGVVQWTTKVNSSSLARLPYEIELTTNNMAIVSSSFWYDTNNSYSALKIAKVNLNSGSKIWEKSLYPYLSFHCMSLFQNMDLDILHNDDIIVSGTSRVQVIGSLDQTSDGFIIKLDKNGDSLWARHIGYDTYYELCQLNDLLLTDDGGFLGVGWHRNQQSVISYQDAWIIKLDSFGCDTPGCQTVGLNELVISNQELVIYPNPASDYITFKFNSSIKKDMELIIYNSHGKVVKRKAVPKSILQQQLNIRDFTSGMYFYRVIIGSEQKFCGKIVKVE
ncbi:MAG: T9SS type A sorting domain-containing protein [Saprospiraceae bacterium]|nr:T9SS type A sorting domain-containing protein [Saprospiraceae bacterium]